MLLASSKKTKAQIVAFVKGIVPNMNKREQMKISTIVLPSEKRFTFGIEDGYTNDDIRFIQDMFDLFVDFSNNKSVNDLLSPKTPSPPQPLPNTPPGTP